MAAKLKAVTSPISLRALIARINRKLAHEEQALKKLRSERWFNDLGNYYVVDLNRNAIMRTHVDPQELGRDLGVLNKWESVEKGE
jgi:hypothetical protein